MSDNNPINFKELFNFSDKSTIEEGIKGIRALKKEYTAFFKSVMDGQMARLSAQEAALMSQNQQLANSIKSLSIANKQHQQQLLASLQASQQTAAAAANLANAQNNVASASTRATNQVKTLSKEYRELKTAYEQAMKAGDTAAMARLEAQAKALDLQIKTVNSTLRATKTAFVAAAGSYKDLEAANRRLMDQLKNMPSAMGQSSKAADILRQRINENTKAMNDFDSKLNRSFKGLGAFSGGLSSLKSDFVSFIAGYASLQGILMAGRAAFDTALSLDSSRAALDFSFGIEGGAEKFEMLRETANRLGLELSSLTNGYKMFAGAAKAANFDMELADRIFQQVANAGARLRLSADDMTGALRAVQQMISKGNVQAEELRGQLGERLPGAFSIAARAMGVTESKLNDMLKAGDVLASDLLPKLADELEKTFGSEDRVDSLRASVNRLINVFTEAVNDGNIGKFFKLIIDGATAGLLALKKFGDLQDKIEIDNLRRKALTGGIMLPGELEKLKEYEKLRNQALGEARTDGLRGAGTATGERLVRGTNGEEAQLKKLLAIEQQRLDNIIKRYSYQKAFAQNPENRDIEGSIAKIKELEQDFVRQKATVEAIKKSFKTDPVVFDTSTLGGMDSEINRLKEYHKTLKEGEPIEIKTQKRLEELMRQRKLLTPGYKEPKTRTKKEKEADGPFDLLQARQKGLEEDLKDSLILGVEDSVAAGEYLQILAKIKKVTEDFILLSEDAIDKRIKGIDLEIEKLQFKYNAGLVLEGDYNKELATLEIDRINQEQLRYERGTQKFIELENKKYEVRKSLSDKTIALIIKQAQIEEDLLIGKAGASFKGVLIKNPDRLTKEERSQLQKAKDNENELQSSLFVIRSRSIAMRLMLEKEGTKEYAELKRQEGELFKSEEERKTAILQEGIDNRLALIRDSLTQMMQITGPLSEALAGPYQELFGSIAGLIESVVTDSKIGIEQIMETLLAANAVVAEEFNKASERRIEALELEKDRELDAVGNNADAKARIEENYRRRIAAERVKQARAEKVFALFQIALNTAIAVTKVTAQTGIAAPLLIPAIIALGAIQAIAVAAQPIPKYKKGRTGGPAEIAVVGEEGPELIEENGNFRLSKGKAHLTYLKQGAKVHTALQSKKMMDTWAESEFANKVLTSFVSGTNIMAEHQAEANKNIAEAISQGVQINEKVIGKLFEEAIEKIPVHEHHVDAFGEFVVKRTKGARIKDLNATTTTWTK